MTASSTLLLLYVSWVSSMAGRVRAVAATRV